MEDLKVKIRVYKKGEKKITSATKELIVKNVNHIEDGLLKSKIAYLPPVEDEISAYIGHFISNKNKKIILGSGRKGRLMRLLPVSYMLKFKSDKKGKRERRGCFRAMRKWVNHPDNKALWEDSERGITNELQPRKNNFVDEGTAIEFLQVIVDMKENYFATNNS